MKYKAMFSLKTAIELIYVIEQLSNAEIDRIFHVFGIGIHLTPKYNEPEIPKTKKVNTLLHYLKEPSAKGPFSDSFSKDLLQYLLDKFYRNRNDWEHGYEDSFSNTYQSLTNSVKLDGYIIKGKGIRKLLPEEIEEEKSETELMRLLDKFSFNTSKGHLQQARVNHVNGNWAGANSQFRSFIESLLIDICIKLLPSNKCENAATAIKLLGNTVSPPFLSARLNEVGNDSPFVTGLWKRLHPEGSHPGLSDDEDSTFRYHTTIVFAYYLLKRLEKR